MADGREVVVRRHDPCPWLPPGSRAEVVRASGTPPAPVALVRLLLTDESGALWTVPRPDGGGLDLPTARVVDGDVASALAGLVAAAPGGAVPRLLGFVRNVVPAPGPDYPWPAPLAHFAVWHGVIERPLAGVGALAGEWLAPDAAAGLADRHWWPLMPPH